MSAPKILQRINFFGDSVTECVHKDTPSSFFPPFISDIFTAITAVFSELSTRFASKGGSEGTTNKFNVNVNSARPIFVYRKESALPILVYRNLTYRQENEASGEINPPKLANSENPGLPILNVSPVLSSPDKEASEGHCGKDFSELDGLKIPPLPSPDKEEASKGPCEKDFSELDSLIILPLSMAKKPSKLTSLSDLSGYFAGITTASHSVPKGEPAKSRSLASKGSLFADISIRTS